MDRDEAMDALRAAEQGGPGVVIKVTGPNSLHSTAGSSARTPLACPECGNTDLTFDYDGVVTINLVDGRLDHVTVGGVLEVPPDRFFCGNFTCPSGQDARPLPGRFSAIASEAISEVIEQDRTLAERLIDGWDVPATPNKEN